MCARDRLGPRGKAVLFWSLQKRWIFYYGGIHRWLHFPVELVNKISGGNLESSKNSLNQEDLLDTARNGCSLGANSEIWTHYFPLILPPLLLLSLFLLFIGRLPFIRHFAKQFTYIVSFNFHTSLWEEYDCYLQLTNKEIKAPKSKSLAPDQAEGKVEPELNPRSLRSRPLTSQPSHRTASSLNVSCSLSPGTGWEHPSMLWETLLGLGLSITSPSLSWTPLTPSTECMKILKWPRLSPFMMTWRTTGKATPTNVSTLHTTLS